MVVPDELAAIIERLEKSGLRYVVTGSLASAAWGQPRATYDAEVFVAMAAAETLKLLAAFPAGDWYLDRDAIVQATREGGEFNAICGATGSKVDFWICNTPADELRLARRRRESIAGRECWLLSPEDVILAKLEWIKAGASDQQRADVVGVRRVQGARLDHVYLAAHAARLGVAEQLADAVSGKWGIVAESGD